MVWYHHSMLMSRRDLVANRFPCQKRNILANVGYILIEDLYLQESDNGRVVMDSVALR